MGAVLVNWKRKKSPETKEHFSWRASTTAGGRQDNQPGNHGHSLSQWFNPISEMDALGLRSGKWLILSRQRLWREQGPAHGPVQPDECKLQRSQCRWRRAGTTHSSAPYFCSKNAYLWSYARRESSNTCKAFLWEQSGLCQCAEGQHPTAGLLPSPWQWPWKTTSSALHNSGLLQLITTNFTPGCQTQDREARRCGFTTVICVSVKLQQLWI